jgi:uncharacterized protein (TIGR02466 family)
MITKKHVEYLYPTPIHTIDFLDTSFCDEIKKHLKNLQKNNIGRDDILCFITPDDLHTRPEFLNLNNIILNEANKILDEIGLIRDDIFITSMWSNISKSENRHATHLHSNSLYSGVLYIEADERSGNIGFKDPRIAKEMLDFNWSDNSTFKHRTIEFEPKKGRLIFFPSWLYHGTKRGKFNKDEDRISLSFNILPKSKANSFSRGAIFTDK